jgi:predicted RNA-binding Zn-ribbon protein involved in translation (DUF1610 family)
MSERAVPFHCPYCGGEDLWPFETPRASAPQGAPHGEGHGSWECRSCLRAFSLKMLGLVRPAGGQS